MATCSLCGSTALTSKHRNGKYEVVHCGACDLGFTHPMPSPQELTAFYSREYFSGGVAAEMGYGDYVGDEKTHRWNAGTVLKALRKASPAASGTLLDVGCAHGFLVDEANRQGWKARGVDMSADAVRYGRDVLGVDVVAGTLHDLRLPDKSLDALTLVGSLDHFADPFGLLGEAARVLAPGGIFAASLGDISGRLPFHWKPPEHLFYFSRRSLQAALERHGFTVVTMKVFWTKYAFKEFVLRLQTYLRFPAPRALLRLPITLTIPTNEVLVVARKVAVS